MQLIHGDCLEVMGDMHAETVDLIVTDPPYLIGYKTNRRKDKGHDFCSEIKGDDDMDLIRESLKEMYRVLKNDSATYIFISPKTLSFFEQEVLSAGFVIRNRIAWVKNSWTAGDLKSAFGAQYEMILLLNKGRRTIEGKRIPDVWTFPRVSGKGQVHQNQKPVDLIEQCVCKHSRSGDIILDPFMGSGTTGLACANTGREFIGIEVDEKYFNIAKDRIGGTP